MDRDDLLIFVYESQLNGKLVSWGDLENKFVRKVGEDRASEEKCAKQTFVNYLKQHWSSGKLQKTFNEEGRPVYFVPEEVHPEIEKLMKEREIHSLTLSLDTRWLEPLRKLLIRMRYEDPEVFFDRYCFTFIGDVPAAFTKSVEAMQSHIAFEKSLRARHLRDLEKLREAVMSALTIGVTDWKTVEERIREEVGWTIGEYLRKLLKKAEKQKGVRKIMTVLGITEEMLKEMYRERVEQERVYKKALHRILEKHHLDIEKPIKDRELLKTVLKEFDEWKKEYWEEDARARISVEKRR